MRVKLSVATAVLTIAGFAEAGLTKPAQEWRRGPEKFVMSDEEEKAWKAVTSDAAAAAFIDLFWARRDPTPGTARNEFREEFLSRVAYADTAFVEQGRRGALTERGQVYILLGPPEKGTRQSMTIKGSSRLSSASARHSDSLIWTWSHEAAAALGVPKLSATFNQIVGTDVYARDTKFGQFSNVSATAIRKTIAHPEMTSVPDWAARVGSEAFSPAPTAAPQGDAKTAGRIGRLVLMSDLSTLSLDAATDPIASLQSSTEFAAGGDLAFVLEYCGSPGTLKVEAKIANLAAGFELVPESMKAIADCGAIPAVISLSGLERGSYELEITTREPNGRRQTAKQRFALK